MLLPSRVSIAVRERPDGLVALCYRESFPRRRGHVLAAARSARALRAALSDLGIRARISAKGQTITLRTIALREIVGQMIAGEFAGWFGGGVGRLIVAAVDRHTPGLIDAEFPTIPASELE